MDKCYNAAQKIDTRSMNNDEHNNKNRREKNEIKLEWIQ